MKFSNKTLAMLNTYRITPAIISEFKKMQNSGVECVLIVNNTYNAIEDDGSGIVQEKELFGVKTKCVLVYEKTLKELGLHIEKDIGYTLWLCIDYLAYIGRLLFKNYDFYWSIDYDCFFNGKNYKPFFDFYSHKLEDLIVSHFRKEKQGNSWYWLANSDWVYPDDCLWYGSRFGITRYSGKLLDCLYKERVRHREVFLKSKKIKKRWLICEFFVASETIKNGFSAYNFSQDGHKILLQEIDLNSNRIFTEYDNKMYHPIKDDLLNRKLTPLQNQINALNTQISDLTDEQKVLIEKINQISFQAEYGTAKARIQNQLSYKLGQAMIENSKSILGYIRMPYVLSYIKDKHKQEQKIYKQKIKKDPSLKLPPLESYPDYKEALKFKEHLSYKLGQALIKANNNWYGGGVYQIVV
ncbi:hypothetical protein [Campylobacter aviculae]|uniref:hypothetical protein n=1 Tax=Campylobacter aviculae TaxID=2510190 RepID=UPI001E538F6A|nr:hypothetical protein [Campylobacter aviculae]